MSEASGVVSALQRIPWEKMRRLGQAFTSFAPLDQSIIRRFKDVEELFGAGWNTVITAEAQNAVYARLEKALDTVRRPPKTSTDHEITSRAAEEHVIQHRRQPGTHTIPRHVLDEIPLPYELLKIAQRHQPEHEWTTDVPVRLFERVKADLSFIGGRSKIAKKWRQEVDSDISWKALTPESAAKVLDYFHGQLKLLDAANREKVKSKKKPTGLLPQRHEYLTLLKFRPEPLPPKHDAVSDFNQRPRNEKTRNVWTAGSRGGEPGLAVFDFAAHPRLDRSPPQVLQPTLDGALSTIKQLPPAQPSALDSSCPPHLSSYAPNPSHQLSSFPHPLPYHSLDLDNTVGLSNNTTRFEALQHHLSEPSANAQGVFAPEPAEALWGFDDYPEAPSPYDFDLRDHAHPHNTRSHYSDLSSLVPHPTNHERWESHTQPALYHPFTLCDSSPTRDHPSGHPNFGLYHWNPSSQLRAPDPSLSLPYSRGL